jgi:hypothetical protein
VAAIEVIDFPFRAQLRSRFASSPGIPVRQTTDSLPALKRSQQITTVIIGPVSWASSVSAPPWSNKGTGEKNEKA